MFKIYLKNKTKERQRKFIKFNKFSFVCLFLLLTFLILFTVTFDVNSLKKSYVRFMNSLGIYTSELTEVIDEASNYDSSGSWKLKQTANWTGLGNAEIKLDLETVVKQSNTNKDIILVLDVSNSLFGDNFKNMISGAKDVVSRALENTNNNIAIITFTDAGLIQSNFSNDEEKLIEILDSLDTVSGATNYKLALQNVVTLLDGYAEKDNTELITLFVTDGVPSLDNPGQVGTYTILKTLYPYIKINAIQYEMDISTVIPELKVISDKQWIAERDNISDAMLAAALSPYPYDSFVVANYVSEYYNVESLDDIKVSNGTVKLEVENGLQKIVWSLDKNSFLTGSKASLTFNALLKDEYLQVENFYPINSDINIQYSLEGNSKNENVTVTPVLKSKYKITYDVNIPDGCELSDSVIQQYNAYQLVNKKTEELSCDGYLFKGWEIDSLDITKLSDEQFVMPAKDIDIRGVWSRHSIKKSMSGTVKEKTTLYKVIENEALNGTEAKEYTGKHNDTIDQRGTDKIYTYYGKSLYLSSTVPEKNNVIFGGFCWQMYRTTDIGGVKMIYNGVPDVNGACGTDRSTHEGISGLSNKYVYSGYAYYYGTTYSYNSSTGKYSLAGDVASYKTSEIDMNSLIGKYTCLSTSSTGTCSPLYKVQSLDPDSSNYLNLYEIKNNLNYSVISIFPYNTDWDSIGQVGYKYGDLNDVNSIYSFDYRQFYSNKYIYSSYTTPSTTYWYADEIDYSSGKYSLVNPYKITSEEEYENLVGKYTFRSTSETNTSTSIYYITAVDVAETDMYYITLKNGNLKDSIVETYNYGDDISINADGTYSLVNASTFSIYDWFVNHETYSGKYICSDGSLTCSNPTYISAAYDYYYAAVNVNESIMIGKSWSDGKLGDSVTVRFDQLSKYGQTTYADYKYTCNTLSDECDVNTVKYIYKFNATNFTWTNIRYFGSSITYDGEKYTLQNIKGPEITGDSDIVAQYRFVCPSLGQTSCEEVGYVFYHVVGNIYSLLLRNGEMTPVEAINNMFTGNNNDSTIKSLIDSWYENNLLRYHNYIDDVVYCNDRRIKDYGRFTNTTEIDGDVLFYGSDKDDDIYCYNLTDSFSVSNEKAKLKYPIGLVSVPELTIMYNTKTQTSGYNSWTLTPHSFIYYDSIQQYYLYSSGGSGYDDRVFASGVRPMIALKKDVEYIDGNGSTATPYIVDTN